MDIASSSRVPPFLQLVPAGKVECTNDEGSLEIQNQPDHLEEQGDLRTLLTPRARAWPRLLDYKVILNHVMQWIRTLGLAIFKRDRLSAGRIAAGDSDGEQSSVHMPGAHPRDEGDTSTKREGKQRGEAPAAGEECCALRLNDDQLFLSHGSKTESSRAGEEPLHVVNFDLVSGSSAEVESPPDHQLDDDEIEDKQTEQKGKERAGVHEVRSNTESIRTGESSLTVDSWSESGSPEDSSELLCQPDDKTQLERAKQKGKQRVGTQGTSLAGHGCIICKDPIYGEEVRAPCGHYYDIGCIRNLFQAATKDETLFPPRCCKKNISFAEVQPHLPEEVVATFQSKQVEFGTLKRVYCWSSTCSRFLGPLVEGSASVNEVYECSALGCGKRTCGKCRAEYSSLGGTGHACIPDADAEEVLELSKESGWARCPGCSQMIELHIGCFHMTCRCRTEFCYLCLARWKTCECRQWDEDRLMAAAEERVDARLGDRGAPYLGAPPRAQTMQGARTQPHASIVSIATGSGSVWDHDWDAYYDDDDDDDEDTFDERLYMVHDMMDRLRDDHECAHGLWSYRAGGGRCQSCGFYLPSYLFRCEGCEMLACNQCRRNRL